MNDQDKTKEQLISELQDLRRQVAEKDILLDRRTATALLQVAPLGIHKCDTEGRITYVNPSQEAITGFTAHELVGKYIWDLLPLGPERDGLPAYLRQLVSEQPAPTSFYAKNVKKNGEVFDVRVDWNYLRNSQGEVTGFASIVSDVTKLKQAEEALQASERRLDTLISNLPGVVFRCKADADMTVEFLSEGYRELTGYDPSELIGKPIARYHELIHPDDYERVFHVAINAVGKRQSYQIEYRIRTASGEEKWVWERGAACYSDSGKLEAVEAFTTDITARKRTELELQTARAELERRVEERTAELWDSNEQLRMFKAFVEASGQSFGVSDMNGNIVYGNAALARLVGLDESEDVYGMHPSMFYADDYQVRQETEIFPVLERDGSWQGELTMKSSTGELIPVLQTSFILKNRDGEPVRHGVVITDLRDIKQAEQAVRESLTELQAIYDAMMDGFGIFDMERLRPIRVNPVLCAMMGYEAEEFLKLTQDKAHLPEDLPWVRKRLQKHLSGEISRTESVPMLRRDGTVVYTDISSRPINYHGRRCLIVFFHDTTQRRESQERLRRSEARYKALIESSPDAVIMCDLEGRILFASPQAARRHGVDDGSELVGRSATDLVIPRDRDLVRLNIRRLVETGIRRNDQYTGLRRDGTTFCGEISGALIYGASGEPEAFVAVYRDITERKKAQRELQREQDALRRMLQASDHDRELITYELHDGVTQQVAGALLHFEAMLKGELALADEAKANLEAGMNALRRAAAEARSLMNRTRTPLLSMYGLRTAIADLVDQFDDRPDAPEIMYRCEARFKRLAPTLENTIFRVAQEAVTNACTHSRGDRVWVSLIQHDDEVCLEVEDNGIGFDPSHAKENRFGLHGIRERTRLLGNDLEITSAPGKGTRIRATFPLTYEDEQTV